MRSGNNRAGTVYIRPAYEILYSPVLLDTQQNAVEADRYITQLEIEKKLPQGSRISMPWEEAALGMGYDNSPQLVGMILRTPKGWENGRKESVESRAVCPRDIIIGGRKEGEILLPCETNVAVVRLDEMYGLPVEVAPVTRDNRSMLRFFFNYNPPQYADHYDVVVYRQMVRVGPDIHAPALCANRVPGDKEMRYSIRVVCGEVPSAAVEEAKSEKATKPARKAGKKKS